MNLLNRRLRLLEASPGDPLAIIQRGIEKESLRVTPQGYLSQRPHPTALGSALTHPSITTDYSEALLEFITPPSSSVSEVLETLENIHRHTCQHLDGELLWTHSMPCMLGADSEIPVGNYGTANVGKMKKIYRIGLGHRYGRLMQTIAGLHYNFSLPDNFWEILREADESHLSLQDYKTSQYLGLIRNFRRHFWLLVYLFGASPAVCRSFVRNREHQLIPVGGDEHSLHAPFATSLRMGDLGYQSEAQQGLMVCYNSLKTYIDTLHEALTRPYPAYDSIGTRDQQGHYLQLNTNLLQIENEFYSIIRPKRTTKTAEAPLVALQLGGIEYIEVRCLDLNPFSPIGITAQQVHFLDVFLMHCLLSDSPDCCPTEYQNIQQNQYLTVYNGRNPELILLHQEGERTFRDWAQQLLEQMQPIAEMLDLQQNTQQHTLALQAYSPWLEHPDLTHSGQILNALQERGTTYFRYAMSQASQHRDYFAERPLSDLETEKFRQLAEQSLIDQQQLEDAPQPAFEEYLANYFEQYNHLG